MNDDIISFRLRRSGLLDALKGFALLGLLLLDYTQHFLYPIYPKMEVYPQFFRSLDHAAYNFVHALFELKMLALFVLVFGVSFYHQYCRMKEKCRSFWPTYMWRLQMLAVVGLLFGLLVPNGGGVIFLAVAGFVLSVVRRFSRNTLFTLAIVFVAQPLTWILFILSFLGMSVNPFSVDNSEMYERIAQNAVDSNWSTYFVNNLMLGVPSNASVWLSSGVGSILIGVLLFGYWLGREGLLSTDGYRRDWWIRCMQIGISSAIVLGLGCYNLRVFSDGDVVLVHLSDLLRDWADIAMMLSLVSGFVIFYKSKRYPTVTSIFRTYGRMSLTNFFLQTFIGIFFFLPVGLLMARYCGSILSLLIAGIVFLLQIQLCRWWQARFKRGPLEYLVHRLTWL